VEIELARSRSGGTRGAGWPEKSKAGLKTSTLPANREGLGHPTASPRKRLAHPPQRPPQTSRGNAQMDAQIMTRILADANLNQKRIHARGG